MKNIISHFTTLKPLICEPFGNGHINGTYFVKTDDEKQYILQKINDKVFTNIDGLMANIFAVTKHLRKKTKDPRAVMTIVPTLDMKLYLDTKNVENSQNSENSKDSKNNGFWRMFDYIEDNLCLDKIEKSADFYESGKAFGQFQRQLSDFDASVLTETIPHFHDTPMRYEQLKNAIKNDAARRLESAKKEVAFALAAEPYAGTLMAAGLPLRVTHNDTKLNNVLFDKKTKKALCIIDLDTVMPGFSVTDFGDAIRFGASTAAEDECDLEKVSLSLELFEAFTSGFISGCELTPAERAHLADGAKMMTLETGIRFLTDYLNGDIYFHISRPAHNLDRCRTQFRLMEDMERKWEDMRAIITKY